MPQYSNDGPTGAFGTFAHRNFADCGSFKLLARESERIERSAAVKSRISCRAGTVPVDDWSSEVFESGVTAAHPAHEMAKAAKTSWQASKGIGVQRRFRRSRDLPSHVAPRVANDRIEVAGKYGAAAESVHGMARHKRLMPGVITSEQEQSG